MTETKWRSRRLERLGSDIFSEVAAWKATARQAGQDVIALDIGIPISRLLSRCGKCWPML